MTTQRLKQIVVALHRARRAGAKLTGKSALERELAEWIAEPAVECEAIEPNDSSNNAREGGKE